MRAISIEDMDFIAGGYDYGQSDEIVAVVEITGESMSAWDKFVYDVVEFFTSTPADQFADDLHNMQEQFPDCVVSGEFNANNGTASGSVTAGVPSASGTLPSASEKITVDCRDQDDNP